MTQEEPGEKQEERARLTPAERRALLEDIGSIAFTLGQSADTRMGASSAEASIPASPVRSVRAHAATSPLERLHLLDALWQEAQGALAGILRQPDTRLMQEARFLPLAQAQGGPQTTTRVAQSPALTAAWSRLRASQVSMPPTERPLTPSLVLSSTSAGHKQVAAPANHALIGEPRPRASANTWANRLIVRILTDFVHEATELERLATFCEANMEARSAQKIARMTTSMRAHPLLRDCVPLSSEETSTGRCVEQIMRCSLSYQRLYGIWRRLAQPLDFDWTHSPPLTLPALEAWHLYEIWCLLQVASALQRTGWQLRPGTLLQATPRGLRLVPATGRASRLEFRKEAIKGRDTRCKIQDTREEERGEIHNPQSTIHNGAALDSQLSTLNLYYQPLFLSANQQRGQATEEGQNFAFASRSHAMQPDMALFHQGRLFLLDPKFKRYALAEEAQNDINKMHAYMDAIVARGSVSRRAPSAVEAAWCLFPGVALGEEHLPENTDVYAYPAATPERPFGTAGVGALRLRPGEAQTTHRLAELLTEWLQN